MLDNCAICLDSLDSKASVDTLCGHIFHKDCLSQLHIQEEAGVVYIQCPLCREHVPPVSQRVDGPTIPFLHLTLGVVVSGFIGATSFWLLLRYGSVS